MPITVRCCFCGHLLKAPTEFAGRRAECPYCGKAIDVAETATTTAGFIRPVRTRTTERNKAAQFESAEIEHFLDPPTSQQSAAAATAAPKNLTWHRMFEALLDPRSIQWMLMIGGGLCVLGLVIWLISLGVFKDPHVLAVALGVGTLAILGAGWFFTLRTRFRIAGQAITFLGCVVAPLNLWFYHAQKLVTVDGHLWVGGVICCLLYAATVVVLRDPVFMYAFEAGITLTTLLLLADMGKITDTTWLSLFFMALGLISIHGERMFSPAEDSDFPRRRFGLPLFWSGHVQIAASLLILLGSQLLGWLVEPVRQLSGFEWAGNLLTSNYLLAAGIWLAGMYAYLYSDIVVRRIGVYLGSGRRLPCHGGNNADARVRHSSRVDPRRDGDHVRGDQSRPPSVARHLQKRRPLRAAIGLVLGCHSGTLGNRVAHPCNQRRCRTARLVVLHRHRVPRRHADHGRGESCERLSVSAFRSQVVGRVLLHQRRVAAGRRGWIAPRAWTDAVERTSAVDDAHPDRLLIGSRLWRGHSAERPLVLGRASGDGRHSAGMCSAQRCRICNLSPPWPDCDRA